MMPCSAWVMAEHVLLEPEADKLAHQTLLAGPGTTRQSGQCGAVQVVAVSYQTCSTDHSISCARLACLDLREA